MSVWFTSDTHFGHANIIRFCDRPFKTVQEMNEKLIANWNECVQPDDDIYHMGDFCFSREPERIARRLNGNIHLILGNHDKVKYLQKCGFIWMKDYYSLRVGRNRFILFHYPIRNWHHCYKGTIHLFGHSHGGTPDLGRSTDIGVDCWDYKPVHINTVLKVMEGRENVKHH